MRSAYNERRFSATPLGSCQYEQQPQQQPQLHERLMRQQHEQQQQQQHEGQQQQQRRGTHCQPQCHGLHVQQQQRIVGLLPAAGTSTGHDAVTPGTAGATNAEQAATGSYCAPAAYTAGAGAAEGAAAEGAAAADRTTAATTAATAGPEAEAGAAEENLPASDEEKEYYVWDPVLQEYKQTDAATGEALLHDPQYTQCHFRLVDEQMQQSPSQQVQHQNLCQQQQQQLFHHLQQPTHGLQQQQQDPTHQREEQEQQQHTYSLPQQKLQQQQHSHIQQQQSRQQLPYYQQQQQPRMLQHLQQDAQQQRQQPVTSATATAVEERKRQEERTALAAAAAAPSVPTALQNPGAAVPCIAHVKHQQQQRNFFCLEPQQAAQGLLYDQLQQQPHHDTAHQEQLQQHQQTETLQQLQGTLLPCANSSSLPCSAAAPAAAAAPTRSTTADNATGLLAPTPAPGESHSEAAGICWNCPTSTAAGTRNSSSSIPGSSFCGLHAASLPGHNDVVRWSGAALGAAAAAPSSRRKGPAAASLLDTCWTAETTAALSLGQAAAIAPPGAARLSIPANKLASAAATAMLPAEISSAPAAAAPAGDPRAAFLEAAAPTAPETAATTPATTAATSESILPAGGFGCFCEGASWNNGAIQVEKPLRQLQLPPPLLRCCCWASARSAHRCGRRDKQQHEPLRQLTPAPPQQGTSSCAPSSRCAAPACCGNRISSTCCAAAAKAASQEDAGLNQCSSCCAATSCCRCYFAVPPACAGHAAVSCSPAAASLACLHLETGSQCARWSGAVSPFRDGAAAAAPSAQVSACPAAAAAAAPSAHVSACPTAAADAARVRRNSSTASMQSQGANELGTQHSTQSRCCFNSASDCCCSHSDCYCAQANARCCCSAAGCVYSQPDCCSSAMSCCEAASLAPEGRDEAAAASTTSGAMQQQQWAEAQQCGCFSCRKTSREKLLHAAAGGAAAFDVGAATTTATSTAATRATAIAPTCEGLGYLEPWTQAADAPAETTDACCSVPPAAALADAAGCHFAAGEGANLLGASKNPAARAAPQPEHQWGTEERHEQWQGPHQHPQIMQCHALLQRQWGMLQQQQEEEGLQQKQWELQQYPPLSSACDAPPEVPGRAAEEDTETGEKESPLGLQQRHPSLCWQEAAADAPPAEAAAAAESRPAPASYEEEKDFLPTPVAAPHMRKKQQQTVQKQPLLFGGISTSRPWGSIEKARARSASFNIPAAAGFPAAAPPKAAPVRGAATPGPATSAAAIPPTAAAPVSVFAAAVLPSDLSDSVSSVAGGPCGTAQASRPRTAAAGRGRREAAAEAACDRSGSVCGSAATTTVHAADGTHQAATAGAHAEAAGRAAPGPTSVLGCRRGDGEHQRAAACPQDVVALQAVAGTLLYQQQQQHGARVSHVQLHQQGNAVLQQQQQRRRPLLQEHKVVQESVSSLQQRKQQQSEARGSAFHLSRSTSSRNAAGAASYSPSVLPAAAAAVGGGGDAVAADFTTAFPFFVQAKRPLSNRTASTPAHATPAAAREREASEEGAAIPGGGAAAGAARGVAGGKGGLRQLEQRRVNRLSSLPTASHGPPYGKTARAAGTHGRSAAGTSRAATPAAASIPAGAGKGTLLEAQQRRGDAAVGLRRPATLHEGSRSRMPYSSTATASSRSAAAVPPAFSAVPAPPAFSAASAKASDAARAGGRGASNIRAHYLVTAVAAAAGPRRRLHDPVTRGRQLRAAWQEDPLVNKKNTFDVIAYETWLRNNGHLLRAKALQLHQEEQRLLQLLQQQRSYNF